MSALLALWLGACGGGAPPVQEVAPAPEAAVEAPVGPAPRTRRVDVRALSIPAGWLAARIGAERVRVTQIAPVGEDPPTWRPSPELVAGLSEADLLVAVGAGYEGWIGTAMLPDARLVAVSDGLQLITIPGSVHRHGKGGEHSHAGADPHLWTDPLLWVEAGARVRDALTKHDPEGAPVYQAAHAALAADAQLLDAALAQATAPLRGLVLLSNHPSFNYLGRRYGLQIRVVDLDPEAPPDAAALAAVKAWQAEAGARAILLWEAQPGPQVIAAFPSGIEHTVLDPVEQPAGEVYDWVKQLTADVERLRRLATPEEAVPSEAR